MTNNKSHENALNVEQSLNSSEAIINKYRNPILYGLAAIVIIVGGYFLYHHFVAVPHEQEAEQLMFKGQQYFAIDQYDKAYTKLETFNKKFPEDMEKSILQMAMQGKLVEQRPEEGTADELYEQIVAEKAQRIKEGKIKKEKPLPEITEDEIPFEILALHFPFENMYYLINLFREEYLLQYSLNNYLFLLYFLYYLLLNQ